MMKTFNKNLILVLGVIIALSTNIICESWAATIVENGSCGTDCTYTLDSEGVLNITGSGTMDNYEFMEDEVNGDYYSYSTAPWGNTAEKMQRITKVVVGGSITNIGNDSFAGATNLSNIEMPNVTSIGAEPFIGVVNLTSVEMPNVTSIGGGAFRGATSLTSVTMPNVTSIGPMAFEFASSLTSVDIPMLEKIGDLAFSDTNMQYANVPSTHVFCINVFDDSTCENRYYTSDLGFSNSNLCVVSDGHLICGSCNGYTKSGTGCVTDCGEGYTANAENQCIKNPEETPEIGEQSGNHVPTAESCYANGQVFYKEQCWDEFPFSKKKWTPAEAAQWLNEDDNTVTITFKK